jgi:hypothetical protein
MRHDWDSIRAEHLRSNLTLRKLAAKHGISFSTLGKRAVRERWQQERERLGNSVATRMETSALEAAEEKGREIGLTAASLIARTITETEEWLDRVESTAKTEKMNPDSVQKLVGSWQKVVKVGRQAFGLGEGSRPPLVRIDVLRNIRLATPAEIQAAKAPAIDVTTIESTDTTAPLNET